MILNKKKLVKNLILKEAFEGGPKDYIDSMKQAQENVFDNEDLVTTSGNSKRLETARWFEETAW